MNTPAATWGELRPDIPDIAYPKITTIEDTFAQGIDSRISIDHQRWLHGWRAIGIEDKFGREASEAYAGEIGIRYKTLARWRWVASGFTPQIINTFKGLPFTFYETVRSLLDDDMEVALTHLENAFHMPKMTVEQFAKIVFPDPPSEEPYQVSIPPISAVGTFDIYRIKGKGSVVGVLVNETYAEWESLLRGHPLRGQRITINTEFEFPV